MIKEKRSIFCSAIITLGGTVAGILFLYSSWSVLFFLLSLSAAFWLMINIIDYLNYRKQFCSICGNKGIEVSKIDNSGPDVGGILRFEHHHIVTITYRCDTCNISWTKIEGYTEVSDSCSR